MLQKLRLFASIALLILLVGSFSDLAASLVFSGFVGTSGGFGTEDTILTFHTTGTEVGCVKWTGSDDAFGAPCPGLSATTTNETDGQTFTLSELAALGISSAGEIGIVLDASEAGGSQFTLVTLVLTFYSADGLTSESFVYTGPAVFNGNTGSGGQGQLFQLDWDQAQIAQANWFTGPNFGNNRIGISAELTGTDGGQDTFYITDVTAFPVPEPLSFLTVGSGLLGLAYWLRRRKA